MIISGGSRSNWRFFGKHLTNSHDNEQVRIAEMRGLISDTVPEALREMDAIASGTRCKNSFYHANINPRYGEHLTDAQWEQAVDLLEQNLGLTGHARFVVEHEKEGRVHRHVVWSRIDPDTMTAVSDSFTARQHERTSRALEEAFGLEPVESILIPDRQTARPERRPKDWETFRGYHSGITPAEVTQEVTALWQGADSGAAFAAALADHGYLLCRGDRRDFCIIDAAGNEHSLARRIEGQKAAQIRARMADVDKEALPSVAEGRALAHERIAQREAAEPALPDADHSVEASEASTVAADAPASAPINSALPESQPSAEAQPAFALHTESGASPSQAGFWGALGNYAARVLHSIRGERAPPVWSVDAIRSFLLSDRENDVRPAPQTIDDYAAPLEAAIRHDGEIPSRDGQTWWQRAGMAVSEMVDTATTWAKQQWSGFTQRLDHERNTTPDDPDMER